MSEINELNSSGVLTTDVESTLALRVGDWLDVVDDDGIWNVAQVLRLPTAETVEVTYDCWGDEYNEELRRDSDRIAPFHTHTWAVKCWAKLDKWPWWPALLTVRAPGSDMGSLNLRLEERLLLDFLDRTDFAERCRCWVKKSQIMAFHSDPNLRKSLSKVKVKKGKKSKMELRSKNLGFALDLLAKCDAREDFPEFVEGTLPVQFEHNFTKPTKQVRIEMGEEKWKLGFANNRINHAATHAYTPMIGEDGKIENDHVFFQLFGVAEETDDTSLPRRCETSQKQEKYQSSISKKSFRESELTMQQSKALRKRARHTPEIGLASDSTTSFLHVWRNIQPRKYRKAPNTVLKTTDMSACSRPLYTSPSYRGPEQHNVINESDQNVQQSIAIMDNSLSDESNSSGEILVFMKKLTRLTKTTLRADNKVREIEAALKSKLDEFAEKAAKAKILRRAAFPIQARAPSTFSSSATQQTDSENKQLRSSKRKATSKSKSTADFEDLREYRAAKRLATAAGLPASAERLPHSKHTVARLELALDDAIMKYQGRNLHAVNTPAELDVVKADLLNFPEVQAAMVPFDHPHFKWAVPTCGYHSESPLPLSNTTQCALEEAKSRYNEFGPHRTLPLSPCKQLSHLWEGDIETEADFELSDSLSSALLDIPQANHSTFGFSVNDNFSIDQWYRDLYPKSFGFQRP